MNSAYKLLAPVEAVRAELERALAKFPTWPDDPGEAANVLGEELGEIQKAILERKYEPHKGVTLEDIEKEAVQLTAMCFRFLASMQRYDFTPKPQHSQTDHD